MRKISGAALLLWLLVLACAVTRAQPAARRDTWTADNGDGTYTNPLFYEEFSDPDMIRVGEYFYLTGTTMHAMPGLPVLRSRDLVNWQFVAYALDRLDLGPQFRLEGGKNIYGQGIWAPSFRYHEGTFYIFSNVNGQTTQLFRATNPAGPWTRTPMKASFHDLSVLFDTDGKVYVVWGYDEIHFARLNEELTDAVPGTERVIIPKGSGMGEGSHFYKIDGRYYITSACWDGPMRKADCDFLTEKARFSYSTDGRRFLTLGPPFEMVFQLKTFQGVRYSLFAYNGAGREGGHADFDSIEVNEPHPRGLMRPVPFGRRVRLTSFDATSGLAARQNALAHGAPTAFTVVDMKLGRVALKSGQSYVTVGRDGRASLEAVGPGPAQTFQWIETPTGELVLMSLASNRFLQIDPETQTVKADGPGPVPDGSDGARFVWSLVR